MTPYARTNTYESAREVNVLKDYIDQRIIKTKKVYYDV